MVRHIFAVLYTNNFMLWYKVNVGMHIMLTRRHYKSFYYLLHSFTMEYHTGSGRTRPCVDEVTMPRAASITVWSLKSPKQLDWSRAYCNTLRRQVYLYKHGLPGVCFTRCLFTSKTLTTNAKHDIKDCQKHLLTNSVTRNWPRNFRVWQWYHGISHTEQHGVFSCSTKSDGISHGHNFHLNLKNFVLNRKVFSQGS